MKIIKAAVTRWLTHGESCTRIISRLKPLIDPLDIIYFEKKDPEAEGVCDLLLNLDLVCMLLLLLEVLAPINIYQSFYRQTRFSIVLAQRRSIAYWSKNL